jgi:hypothetical protein
MTYVVEQSVDVDTPGEDAHSTRSGCRLLVGVDGRTVTFRIEQSRVLRVVSDTHQPESPSPSEIPTEIRNHVLYFGYRIHGDNVDDGGFELLRGDVDE